MKLLIKMHIEVETPPLCNSATYNYEDIKHHYEVGAALSTQSMTPPLKLASVKVIVEEEDGP